MGARTDKPPPAHSPTHARDSTAQAPSGGRPHPETGQDRTGPPRPASLSGAGKATPISHHGHALLSGAYRPQPLPPLPFRGAHIPQILLAGADLQPASTISARNQRCVGAYQVSRAGVGAARSRAPGPQSRVATAAWSQPRSGDRGRAGRGRDSGAGSGDCGRGEVTWVNKLHVERSRNTEGGAASQLAEGALLAAARVLRLSWRP